ncbi:MAG: site-2 protease family protein [Pirellulales bacterium]
MLIGEPQRTPGDLFFSIFGIPVRVHPFFWLVAAVLGLSGDSEPIGVFIWVGVVFFSILIHELGHAFAARARGAQPWITLYGMGGLTSFSRVRESVGGNIAVTFAGPAAGFLVTALVLASLLLFDQRIFFVPSLFPFQYGPGFENPYANFLVANLLFVNFFWGLVNLLPVYPLDGGQIARELLVWAKPSRGIMWSLGLSMAAAVGVAVLAFMNGLYFAAILFGYLGYSSMATMQAYQGRGGPR